jgi:hypothetical protein
MPSTTRTASTAARRAASSWPRSAWNAASALSEYLEIGGMVDGGLANQVDFDLDNFTRATGRTLSVSERETVAAVQRQGMRWTYLGSGMTHPKFAGALGELLPAGADRVAKIAEALC